MFRSWVLNCLNSSKFVFPKKERPGEGLLPPRRSKTFYEEEEEEMAWISFTSIILTKKFFRVRNGWEEIRIFSSFAPLMFFQSFFLIIFSPFLFQKKVKSFITHIQSNISMTSLIQSWSDGKLLKLSAVRVICMQNLSMKYWRQIFYWVFCFKKRKGFFRDWGLEKISGICRLISWFGYEYQSDKNLPSTCPQQILHGQTWTDKPPTRFNRRRSDWKKRNIQQLLLLEMFHIFSGSFMRQEMQCIPVDLFYITVPNFEEVFC